MMWERSPDLDSGGRRGDFMPPATLGPSPLAGEGVGEGE